MSKKDKKKNKAKKNKGYQCAPEETLFHIYEHATKDHAESLSRSQFETLYQSYNEAYLDETLVKEEEAMKKVYAEIEAKQAEEAAAEPVEELVTEEAESSEEIAEAPEASKADKKAKKAEKKAMKAAKKAQEKEAKKEAKKDKKKSKKDKQKDVLIEELVVGENLFTDMCEELNAELEEVAQTEFQESAAPELLWDPNAVAIFYAEALAKEQIEKKKPAAAELLRNGDKMIVLLDQVEETIHSLNMMLLNDRLKSERPIVKSATVAATRIVNEAPELVDLMRQYRHGAYTRATVPGMTYILAALLYLEDENDIIPDNIPGIGYLDDLSVLKLAEKEAAEDLVAFRTWKQGRV